MAQGGGEEEGKEENRKECGKEAERWRRHPITEAVYHSLLLMTPSLTSLLLLLLRLLLHPLLHLLFPASSRKLIHEKDGGRNGRKTFELVFEVETIARVRSRLPVG